LGTAGNRGAPGRRRRDGAPPPADRVNPPVTVHRPLPLLVLLFFGSGCAALIYEIVWFQMLQLVIGSSAVSLAVLLGTFMGGMCLGSFGLAWIVSARWHPLKVYALLETTIGVLGVLLLLGIPAVGRIYVAGVGHGLPGILLRGTAAALCLLPPTMLMGATLPAISRWVDTTPRGVSWLGLFYGGNTAGAVAGCLLAGFYLLRVFDTAVATCVAAGLNLTVAVVAWVLAGRDSASASPPVSFSTGRTEHNDESKTKSIDDHDFGFFASLKTAGATPRGPAIGLVHIAIALSGLTALGAEVVWTRLLSLLLGGTVYTFSIILAVFLAGIGLGSAAGSALGRANLPPRLALGLCQAALVATIAWAGWMIARSLPYWPVDPSLSTSPWFNFQLDLVRCLWAILPSAVLWGASFPLAVAAVAAPGQDPAHLTGTVYAANTVGAIVGAAGFSVLLLASFGTYQAERLLIGLAAVAALIVLVPTVHRSGLESLHWQKIPATGAIIVFAVLAALAAASLPPVPGGLIAWGRYLPNREGKAAIIYTGEGRNSSVAITEWSNDVRYFHVSGKVEASTEPQDMRLQRLLGHLPALVHPQPRSVLVVGCGAGVTAGSFVVHPEIERIVICEIEPLIPQVVARYFADENHHVLQDRRLQIVYDDARHYLLTTRESFDIITSDPIHPWVKGAATLYTREYYELCRARLNPGGVLTQWVPLYESSAAAVKSELATFLAVFPHGTVWSNDDAGRGYDTVVLGQTEPTRIDVEAVQRRLERPDHAEVAWSLETVGFKSAIDLLATFAVRSTDLGAWLRDAEINRDRNLRLQYLAGMGAHLYHSEEIHRDLTAQRRFPDGLFTGSDARLAELRKAMGLAKP
jgi:spermidine synthase